MKLYTNEAWLRTEMLSKRKGIEQIGKEQGVDPATIYRWAKKFGIPMTKNSRRSR